MLLAEFRCGHTISNLPLAELRCIHTRVKPLKEDVVMPEIVDKIHGIIVKDLN